MPDLTLKCYLIDCADQIIRILSKPITNITESNDDKYNLHSKWTTTYIDLYNSRIEFLLMGESRQNGKVTEDSKLFTNKFDKNYEDMKIKLNHIENSLHMWNDIENDFGSEHFVLDLDQRKKHRRKSFLGDDSNFSLLKSYKTQEEQNSIIIETGMLQLILFMFQYVNTFEEDSIKTNLWNYCLRSITFSWKCFFIGIVTLIAQYTWIGSLVYHVITNFDISQNPNIILITIITTSVSLLYSYISLSSFFSSRKMYKFLIKLYDDYPEIVMDKNIANNEFYISKKITMKSWHIRYNYYVDFLSNCILPIIIPILNIFIIANSETPVDAILNSVAVFFIIQIDEDLLSLTEYENEKNTIKFSKWIISSIYCKHFNVFTDIFKLEYNSWCSNVFRLSKRFRNKNRVSPLSPKGKFETNNFMY
jgi:hypothetical protein